MGNKPTICMKNYFICRIQNEIITVVLSYILKFPLTSFPIEVPNYIIIKNIILHQQTFVLNCLID